MLEVCSKYYGASSLVLHAEVGRHVYAPLVGDSFEPLKYHW